MATATEEERTPLEVRRAWAWLIRQAYEVDPQRCPRCGGTMKTIAVIKRPAVICQILEHLEFPAGPPSLCAPLAPSERGNAVATAQPREWLSEPLYDDLPLADVAGPVMTCANPAGAGLSHPCVGGRSTLGVPWSFPLTPSGRRW